MNVLLINPPTKHIIRESLPPVVEDDTGVFPPLGLLYVAAYAEEVDGCSVTVLDCQAERIGHDGVREKIQTLKPDIVGLQVMTFTLIDAYLVAETVKAVHPEAYVVFGGPHVTLFPFETVQLQEVDAVIPGEGEFVFKELLTALVAGKPAECISGVITKKTEHGPIARCYLEDLNILKLPARHLVDTRHYSSPLARKNPLTTIMSSRGCPAQCIFCDRPQMGKKFRKRSAVHVVNEMINCQERFGINEFIFYDDTFTIDRQRVLDICDLISERKVKLYWDIRARVDTMTPLMISKLRKAGCYRIHYGVESGSPKIQKRLGKNLNLDTVKEVFRLTKKEGIEVLGYFMIGCPDETREDVHVTFDMMKKLPMDYIHVGIFTPYPGTAIYHEALSTGMYKNDYWKTFAMHPTDDFTPSYWHQYFSTDELMTYMKKAYAEFYGRPHYMIQRLLRIRSFDELMRKGTLGFKLLKSVCS